MLWSTRNSLCLKSDFIISCNLVGFHGISLTSVHKVRSQVSRGGAARRTVSEATIGLVQLVLDHDPHGAHSLCGGQARAVDSGSVTRSTERGPTRVAALPFTNTTASATVTVLAVTL